ncbi:MAG: TAT-variant-translocated molybdopterin oxidoreductase [Acidobacteria bacterium]|nr:TAT-variant-translocated molybdopterin oxidoreductase [Acidobacteriota bacterium]
MPTKEKQTLSSIREELNSKQGRQFWRSIEELTESEEFLELIRNQYPRQASLLGDAIDRRRFLQVMGASFALGGLTACNPIAAPTDKIVPYVRAPEEILPGKPLYYATSMVLGGFASGILVETHMGRPTKVEGNPDHPASLGATSAYAQASVLDLYDPDRSKNVLYYGQPRPFDVFLRDVREFLPASKAKQGAGIRFLSETVTSPTLTAQFKTFLETYPQAKWYQYDAVNRDNYHEGTRLAFGSYAHPVYHFDKADVVVSLDANFLGDGPGAVRYTKDFSKRHRVRKDQKEMSRLYVAETMPSVTGTVADHRMAAKPSEILGLAKRIAAGVGVPVKDAPAGGANDKWITALIEDLKKNKGKSVVLAGDNQPPAVHALAHAINQSLENNGKTVTFTEPLEATLPNQPSPQKQAESLKQLVQELDAGQVELLIILGGNPAYTAPADLQFGDKVKKAKTAVHLSSHYDETSVNCHWHIPQSHFLETWSDACAFDGTVSIVQPLIEPIYKESKSAHELLVAFLDQFNQSSYSVVREFWMKQLQLSGEGFETAWRRALHHGFLAGKGAAQAPAAAPAPASTPSPAAGTAAGVAAATKPAEPKPTEPKPAEASSAKPADKAATEKPYVMQPEKTVTAQLDAVATAVAGMAAPTSKSLEVHFAPDPGAFDGRFANNGWLQETPKPITKVTWENAVHLSPKTAAQKNLKSEDLVEISFGGRKIATAPVWVVPGHAEDSVTLHLGYGRSRAGQVGNDIGFNVFALRSTTSLWGGDGLSLNPTGDTHHLASTQLHFRMEDRELIRIGTLEEFQKLLDGKNAEKPSFVKEKVDLEIEEENKKKEPMTVFTPSDHIDDPKGYQWGMSVDTSACTGCNACVVACTAENNIPVVGKLEVLRGREMHWMRIDQYHTGSPDDPDIYVQPVMCQHCENAPCEVVCPVEATSHSTEGINEMTYNRCVGTKYCSNNCPYKVRRFNFLAYSDYDTPVLKLGRNPNVTVRSRGVMEKCTFCVQRVNAARIEAEKRGTPVEDGEIVTACQGACPAEAIVFGNINDPHSKVSKLKEEPTNYDLLAEINVRPRTSYLATVRNVNKDIPKTADKPEWEHNSLSEESKTWLLPS